MLNIDRQQLTSLLEDFHLLTGIRIVVRDDAGSERCSVPETLCEFCEYIRTSPEGRNACRRSDDAACAVCRKTGKPYLYTCHTGLTECVAPIMQGGVPIGYIMLGQTRREEDDCALAELRAQEYGLDGKRALELYRKIGRSPENKIRAAVAVMDACASYLYYHRLIAAEERTSIKIEEYVSENLNTDLSVKELCRRFRLSRVDLYACCRQAFGCTPAEYVRRRRLERACELLRETRLPVTAVAAQAGIGDYNYFSKVFRARYGVSPRAFRNAAKSGRAGQNDFTKNG